MIGRKAGRETKGGKERVKGRVREGGRGPGFSSLMT